MAKTLTSEETQILLDTLQQRFEKNHIRHEAIVWEKVQEKLLNNPGKLWSLHEMERTGGEPDVVGYDKQNDQYIFYDCAAESPKGRRSICFDPEALASRKLHKPANSAVNMAREMGIEILSEKQYRELQELGSVDTKTSSWIQTPTHIRKLGGALFGDFRYGTVFIYHNGAESYYGARAFRGSLRV